MQGQLISNDFTDLGSLTIMNENVTTVAFDQPAADDHQIAMDGTTKGGKLHKVDAPPEKGGEKEN